MVVDNGGGGGCVGDDGRELGGGGINEREMVMPVTRIRYYYY